MNYETVIGLEVHSQLLTESKMFCSCRASYQDSYPNTMVCEVCLGMPGVMPVINRRAVELVISTGLALGCDISEQTKFDRKNYPYPDLMKGYQISQYDQPIASDGTLSVESDSGEKQIGITRVHLEEDVAKLAHEKGPDQDSYSLLDVNRAGVPLMEIVSEPDMRSPDEARSYLTTLHTILRYIGVSTANMEEGNFRCDANISVRPVGSQQLGSKVEVKNMNSFRSVFEALNYEMTRQVHLAEDGNRIVQETRGWVDGRRVTVSQRTKEHASDYRYFPEPDLPPVTIPNEWVEEIKAQLPELPHVREKRMSDRYGLSQYDAKLLASNKATADFFETSVEASDTVGESQQVMSKAVGNWITGELSRLLNLTDTSMDAIRIKPGDLIGLIRLVEDGVLSISLAKTVFEEMFHKGGNPKVIAEAKGLVQISDVDSISSSIDETVSANPGPVSDYVSGKDAALGFLVGQIMKLTQGKANPRLVSELLQEKLDSLR